MESKPGNWTCIALAVFLASAPPVTFAQAPDRGDARHCLDLGSNQAIIQCAEQYRPGGSRSAAKARREAAPAAAPAAPAPAPPPAASAPKASPEPATPPAPRRKSRKREADARHCLDAGSIMAIARCAEKYR